MFTMKQTNKVGPVKKKPKNFKAKIYPDMPYEYIKSLDHQAKNDIMEDDDVYFCVDTSCEDGPWEKEKDLVKHVYDKHYNLEYMLTKRQHNLLNKYS